MDLNDGLECLPEPDPWGIPVIDATPRAVLDHTIGDVEVLLARVRHNKLIDRMLNCVAHSLHTNLHQISRRFGETTVGEVYYAVNNRGKEFVVALQVKTTTIGFGHNRAERDFEVCKELFPRLSPRFVHIELVRFSWGDIVAMYSLRHTNQGIQLDDEVHYRLVSPDPASSGIPQKTAIFGAG